MNKLFTFGCSFTKSDREPNWPTWADILGRGFKYYKNWGHAGGGNSFIFYRLMECIKREQITSHDTVIIMWTNIAREDRYIDNFGWITPGNIYSQTFYDQNFVQKCADPTGYLIKDMATIAAAKYILESIGCKFYFLSTVPLSVYDDHWCSSFGIDNEILKLYREEINFIKPSVYSVVFNNDWYSRVGFIDKKELNREYNAIAGPDWPSWEKFLQHDFQGVPTAVKKEIASHNFAKRLATRTNTHPLPSEHLIYLEQVLPDLAIDQTTRLLVEQTTDAILKHKPLVKWWGKKCNPETF
jgi:hypothetical protein